MLKVFSAMMVFVSLSAFASTQEKAYLVSTKIKMNGENIYNGGLVVANGQIGEMSTQTYGDGTSLQIFVKDEKCPSSNQGTHQKCVRLQYSVSDIHGGTYELLSNPLMTVALNKDATMKVKNINGDELEILTKVQDSPRVPASAPKEEPIGTQISRDIQDKEP